jgi:hypothetical protein
MLQTSGLSQFANLQPPSLAGPLRSQMPPLFAQDSGNDSHPEDSGEILPPGKLRREDSDSALTGITRSLQRRVLGLRVLSQLRDLAKRRTGPTPPEKMD